jgi:hypothetical protein
LKSGAIRKTGGQIRSNGPESSINFQIRKSETLLDSDFQALLNPSNFFARVAQSQYIRKTGAHVPSHAKISVLITSGQFVTLRTLSSSFLSPSDQAVPSSSFHSFSDISISENVQIRGSVNPSSQSVRETEAGVHSNFRFSSVSLSSCALVKTTIKSSNDVLLIS